MASRGGGTFTVVTFNFDDILEMYLDFHGLVVSSIVDDRHWSDNSDVRVYHPHGLLSFSGVGRLSGRIVLDQSSYSAFSGEKGRLWRTEILGIMRSHLCLFIGLSGSDDNLEKLMYDCKEEHVGIHGGLPFWGVRFTDNKDSDWKSIWAEWGVSTWVVTDYEKDLPEFLLEVCGHARDLRKRFSRV
jgi:hypothetical protein